jgi:hypothetical protein
MNAEAPPSSVGIDGDLSDSEAPRGRVAVELAPGERVVWTGFPVVPPPLRPFWPAVCLATAAVSCAVAFVAFKTLALDPGAHNALLNPIGYSGYALAVVALAALYIVVSRRNRLRRKRANTLYALTDRRALSWRPAPESEALIVDTAPLAAVRDVKRSERPDGTGDLTLMGTAPAPLADRWGPFRFEGLAEVRQIDGQIRMVLGLPVPKPPHVGEEA